MKRWHLLVIGLATYAIALIVIAPATLIDGTLERASQGRLRLAQAQGSLWSGSGQIELRDDAGQAGIARNVSWRVLPESLLRAHLVSEVELVHSGARFPVTLSASGIEISNADLELPAAVLGLGVTRLAPLGLTGDVLIHIAGLWIARDAVDGTATVQWRDAGSTLSPVSPLGDYEMRLDAEGSMVHADLRTIRGTLQLEGKGSWARGARPEFLVTARVPADHQQQLAPLLRLIAVERGRGSFELAIN